MKIGNVNVVTCPPCGESTAKSGVRGAYKATSLISPSIGPADHFLRKGGRKGFTLIELLVVVLIIGILAAVAVPQYQKAVLKSRITKFLPILKNITDAQETYYLANGTYTKELSDLDIEIPTFTPVDYNYNGTMFHYDDDMFLLDMNADEGHIALNYCPSSNETWNTCAPKRDFQIIYVFQHSLQSGYANKQLCKVFYNSKIGQEICASFGNFESAS